MQIQKHTKRSIWIGYDPREHIAYEVARSSIRRRTNSPYPISPIALCDPWVSHVLTRPIEYIDGKIWDPVSGAWASTEFAISRFLTPHYAKDGWALFMDCDMLCRGDITELFELADPRYAVLCVHHNFNPPEGVKMDGQYQLSYNRKNWSSVMLFNCDHESNRNLTLEMINTLPGRDLHRFCWLKDEEIGILPPTWNWLAGYSEDEEANMVHFTDGLPSMPGYSKADYADEWWEEVRRVIK